MLGDRLTWLGDIALFVKTWFSSAWYSVGSVQRRDHSSRVPPPQTRFKSASLSIHPFHSRALPSQNIPFGTSFVRRCWRLVWRGMAWQCAVPRWTVRRKTGQTQSRFWCKAFLAKEVFRRRGSQSERGLRLVWRREANTREEPSDLLFVFCLRVTLSHGGPCRTQTTQNTLGLLGSCCGVLPSTLENTAEAAQDNRGLVWSEGAGSKHKLDWGLGYHIQPSFR